MISLTAKKSYLKSYPKFGIDRTGLRERSKSAPTSDNLNKIKMILILMLHTLLLRNILRRLPCDKHTSFGARGQGLVGGRGGGQAGGEAKEGGQKGGHRKNSDPSSYYSRGRQGIQSPILPKRQSIFGFARAPYLFIFRKGRWSI